jgi:hypothetical protein
LRKDFAFGSDVVGEQVGSFFCYLLDFAKKRLFLRLIVSDKVGADLADFSLKRGDYRLEDILVSKYANLVFEKVVFDFEMWIPIVVFDHT